MNARLLLPLLALLVLGAGALRADVWSGEDKFPANLLTKTMGPYEILVFDEEVLANAAYDKAGNVWVAYRQGFEEKEVRVRISNREGAGYRLWNTGEQDLVAAANRGNRPGQWTDWVKSSAPYIEYWMDGELILHLKRHAD